MLDQVPRVREIPRGDDRRQSRGRCEPGYQDEGYSARDNEIMRYGLQCLRVMMLHWPVTW